MSWLFSGTQQQQKQRAALYISLSAGGAAPILLKARIQRGSCRRQRKIELFSSATPPLRLLYILSLSKHTHFCAEKREKICLN
jgi:hypothetical protein